MSLINVSMNASPRVMEPADYKRRRSLKLPRLIRIHHRDTEDTEVTEQSRRRASNRIHEEANDSPGLLPHEFDSRDGPLRGRAGSADPPAATAFRKSSLNCSVRSVSLW